MAAGRADAAGSLAHRFPVPGINSLATAPDGTIYAACNDGAIRVYDSGGAELGIIKPISGVFRYPTSIFYFDGRLYLTDLWHKHVAVIEPDGKPLFTIGDPGKGPKRFSEPGGVYVWKGLIYVADRMGGVVQVFGPNGIYLNTIALPELERGLGSRPVSVAVDGRGYVYVVEEYTSKVLIFDDRWTLVDSIKKVRGGSFVSIAGGSVLVADRGGDRYAFFDINGNPLGMTGYMGSADDEFLSIGPAVLDSMGRLVAADPAKEEIKIFNIPDAMIKEPLRSDFMPGNAIWEMDFDLSGDVLPAKAVKTKDGGMLLVDYGGRALVEVRGERVERAIRFPGWRPIAITHGPDGDIWVLDSASRSVMRLSPDGELISRFGAEVGKAAGAAQNPGALVDPSDILVTSGGEVMVADSGAGKVNVYSETGRYLGRLGRGGTSVFISKPISMDIDDKDTIYVLDAQKPSILLYSVRGAFIREIGGYGSERSLLQVPVALRLVGEDIAVLDAGNNTVRLLTKSGDRVMQFGSEGEGMGEFNAPQGILYLGEGRIAISDTGNSRISYLSFTNPE